MPQLGLPYKNFMALFGFTASKSHCYNPAYEHIPLRRTART